MIPKIIHQTWKNSNLPKKFANWHEKVKNYNLNCIVKLWTDDDIYIFMEEKYPEYLELFRSYKLPIEKVDVWRYFVLHYEGGMYLDLDMDPYSSFDELFDNDIVLALEPTRYAKSQKLTYMISQAVMLSKPNHPFFSYIISRLKNFAHYTKLKPLSTTGPIFMTNMYEEFKPAVMLLSHDCFSEKNIGKYASHQCMGTWRQTMLYHR
jgi:mannosyltransferase OCH1-like enzyme